LTLIFISGKISRFFMKSWKEAFPNPWEKTKKFSNFLKKNEK